MTQDQPFQSILRNRTPILIGVVTVLQVLDWHSTLSAPQGRFETNKLLNWLSQWVSFFCVLSTVKLIFIATLLGGFLYWRKHKGVYELEYTACLSVLVLVYGAVVFNNYFS